MSAMGWLLVVAVLGLAWPYVLYPLVLSVVSRAFARPEWAEQELPRVAILVSAFNEESRIRDKILNFAALDYPADRLQMWIGTDGSTDGTADVVRAMGHPRVHLVERRERTGKTLVLNDLAAQAFAGVFVFTDVNANFRPDAVRHLVAPMADPETGLVSGRTVILRGAGNVAVEGAYYRFESLLKAGESACGWLAGADGAVYALRAKLYRPLPAELINDLVHPCQVVADGYTARFEPLAVSEEHAGDGAEREFDRQTRIAAQASYLLAGQTWPLLRKFRWGMQFVLLSHKWLRWIAGIWIPLGFVALMVLFPLAGIASLLLFVLIGIGWRKGAGWADIPVFFLIVHTAYLRGLWQAVAGERYIVWKPRAG